MLGAERRRFESRIDYILPLFGPERENSGVAPIEVTKREMRVRLPVFFLRQPREPDADGSDPESFHFLNGEGEFLVDARSLLPAAGVRSALRGSRRRSCTLRFRDLVFEDPVEIVDRQIAGDGIEVGTQFPHMVHLGVVLVADFADDLLEEVLQGDDPFDAAELVDHDGDVQVHGLHLPQDELQPGGIRNEMNRVSALPAG